MHNPTYRVMEILKLIGSTPNLTLTEISNRLDFSKSTIQPILMTLSELGYIIQNEDTKTFKIGMETYKISQGYLGNSSTMSLLKKHMMQIVSKCNEICQMGINDSNNPQNVFYIAKEEPSQAITLISSIGTSLPAHATALGKCLLSSYTNEEIRNLYKDGMKKLTSKTITDVDQLIKQLEAIRYEQYSFEKGEATEGIVCIAVPLKQNSKVVASLSVSLPEYRASEEKLDYIKSVLLEHMNDINLVLLNNLFSI